ncbi:MAG: riboflavin synthase [Dehalococcoidales bacterium]|nr:riboflavin synthase [Dehalococcoidales bacterium]
MFTGIVEEIGKVTSVQPGNLVIAAGDVLRGMEVGGSMAVNGVCLTITRLNNASFSADLMAETVKRSNLGLLRAGDKVNLERPLAMGGRLGGHLVQGHIDATGRVASVRWDGEARLIRCEAPPEVMRYVVEKGFIAVDGLSLTVVARDTSSFQVSLVTYTRQNTTLEGRQVGDLVNLEVDIIAKYVERLDQARRGGVTADFLQEHGFLVS